MYLNPPPLPMCFIYCTMIHRIMLKGHCFDRLEKYRYLVTLNLNVLHKPELLLPIDRYNSAAVLAGSALRVSY